MRATLLGLTAIFGLVLCIGGCGMGNSNSAAVSSMVVSNASHRATTNSENIDVVGISIVKPDPKNQYGGSAIPGQQPGTTVHVRIRDEQRNFISIKKDSKVKLLAHGQSLTDKTPTSFGFMAQISDDGHSCTIPIHGKNLPPADTNSLQVKGKIGLVAASDSTTDKQVFAVKKGYKFELAGVPVEISEIGKPWNDEFAVDIQFQSTKPFDAIQQIEFFDESGKPIESTASGKTNWGIGGSYTYTVGYSLKRKTKKVVAEVKYFKSTEQIEIPVDFQVGLGIGN